MQRIIDEPVTLGELSDELCLLIFRYLPASTLKKLSETSRRFYGLSIELMYHTIDLSIHHLEPVYIINEHHFVDRLAADFKDIVVKQHLFIKQMLRKPQYASLVRSFTWTTSIGSGYLREPFPGEFRGENALWLAEKVYAVFSLLDRATSIDIDTGPDHVESLDLIPLSPRPSLFPNARHIQLGGKMHYALASAILHGSKKAPLSSLTLNNVQEGGLLASGENYDMGHRSRGAVRRSAALSTVDEDWPEGFLPKEVGPGNMRRLLNSSLESRCRHLQYLSLRKQGQQCHGQTYPGPLTHEDAVYHEWAAFIQAIRPPTLVLAHGGHTDSPCNGRCILLGLNFHDRVTAPMDERFRDILMPVLQAGWDELTRMRVEGVSRSVLGGLSDLHSQITFDEQVKWCWNGVVGLR